MKCYFHEDRDAIGTCINCGKVVCSLCAETIQGRLTCRMCVDSAWVDGTKQETTNESTSRTYATIDTPIDTGNRNLFLMGGIGNLILVVVVVFSFIAIQLSSSGVSVILIALINIVASATSPVGGILAVFGLFGLYRYYELTIALFAVITQISSMIASGIMNLVLSSGSLPSENISLLFAVSLIGAINGLVIGVTVYQARDYTGYKELTQITGLVFLISIVSIFYFNLIAAFARFLLAVIFFRAQMPQVGAWLSSDVHLDW